MVGWSGSSWPIASRANGIEWRRPDCSYSSARDRTGWLPPAIKRDDHGFVLTGTDIDDITCRARARRSRSIGPLAAPPLTIGDLVDVLAVVPALAEERPRSPADQPSLPLVEAAVVVDVSEQSIAVAVPETDAPRVAWVLTNGSVMLAVAGA